MIYRSDTAEIWQGDALRFLDTVPPAMADVLICDPPYNSGGPTGQKSVPAARKYLTNDSGNQGKLVDFPGDSREQLGYLTWAALCYPPRYAPPWPAG